MRRFRVAYFSPTPLSVCAVATFESHGMDPRVCAA